ncbi:hypothetical protein OHB00_07175 [Streptomyces sp. NBC_00631]|uniref:hypothetical protein n=1 Tax=Streptomyces sp. NBC_00631 TaxID=2975793 RepID=UPI0030E3ED77
MCRRTGLTALPAVATLTCAGKRNTGTAIDIPAFVAGASEYLEVGPLSRAARYGEPIR